MSKNFLIRIIPVFLGTILMGIGIEIIVVADQGFDSVSTLILGLMNHSTIPFGRWSQLISIVFLLVTFFYKRSMLGAGSIINTLLVGETINRIAPTLQSIDVLQNNIFASLLGFFIMALGTALYLSGELGSGPLEGMMFCICDLLHITLQKGRVLLDFIIVISGVLLGGSFGLGTAFAIFLLGPMIQADNLILENIKLKSFWSRQKKKRLTE